MNTYDVRYWRTGEWVGRIEAPTNQQARQKMAGLIKHQYPGKSIIAITGMLSASKVGKQSFGGRPKIYD